MQNVEFTSYWNYDGSLTQPPCTEDIKWTVIKDVQSISPYQLRRIRASFANFPNYEASAGNNRALQEIGTRQVYFSGAERVLISSVSTLLTLAFVLNI